MRSGTEIKDGFAEQIDCLFIEEQRILKYSRNKKYKKLPMLADFYKKQLQQCVSFLREVSVCNFKSLQLPDKTAKNVSNATSADALDYTQYIGVMNHLVNRILSDILYQTSLSQMLMSIERWVYILKKSYEQHDYFTASAITSALSTRHMISSGMLLKLSEKSSKILHYFVNVITNPAMFSLQEFYFKQGNTVIPSSAALEKRLTSLGEVKDKSVRLSRRSDCFDLFQEMRVAANLKVSSEAEDMWKAWSGNKGDVLDHSPRESSDKIRKRTQKKKFAFDVNAVTKHLALYESETDRYYEAKYAIDEVLVYQLNEYAANPKTKHSYAVLAKRIKFEILFDTKLSYADKLKALGQIRNQDVLGEPELKGIVSQLFSNLLILKMHAGTFEPASQKQSGAVSSAASVKPQAAEGAKPVFDLNLARTFSGRLQAVSPRKIEAEEFGLSAADLSNAINEPVLAPSLPDASPVPSMGAPLQEVLTLLPLSELPSPSPLEIAPVVEVPISNIASPVPERPLSTSIEKADSDVTFTPVKRTLTRARAQAHLWDQGTIGGHDGIKKSLSEPQTVMELEALRVNQHVSSRRMVYEIKSEPAPAARSLSAGAQRGGFFSSTSRRVETEVNAKEVEQQGVLVKKS